MLKAKKKQRKKKCKTVSYLPRGARIHKIFYKINLLANCATILIFILHILEIL